MNRPHKTITSVTNPRVKQAVALRHRATRNKQRKMIVEGPAEIDRAHAAGIRFQPLFVCRSLLVGEPPASLTAAGTEVIEVTEPVFEKLACRENVGGLLGVAAQPDASLDGLTVRPDGLWVVLVGLEKPGNLGAILRTADAVGVDGLIVCDRGTDLWNPNVIRASLGAVFTVPLAAAGSEATRDWLQANQIALVAARPQADCRHTEATLSGPVAIVLGEEHAGLDDAWTAAADRAVRIPMHGQVDSLNVSTSAAILLYEADRQRR